MPYFMNNQGNCVVPTLETLAMLADGLTEDTLRHLPPLLQELTQDMHRRVDYKPHGSGGLPAVYLASDTKASDTPCRSMEVNLSRNSFAEDASFKCSEKTETFNSRQVAEWTLIKQVVTSRLGDIEAVIYEDDRRFDFVRLRPGRGTKMALEITPSLFDMLVADGIDLRYVKRLFMADPHDDDLQVCLSSLPGLTSLDYIVTGSEELELLVSLRHTLRELRIIFDFRESENFENFRPQVVLQQLSKLNLLFMACGDYEGQSRQEIDSWELPSSLRSLGIQDFQRLRAVNIIRFLTREVDYKGNKFTRQALLDDLTIIRAKDGVMNEVYRSEALTRRMQERIYSDLDGGHYVAASKLLAARHEKTFVIRPDEIYDTIETIINLNTCFQGPIHVVLCEHLQYLTRNSYHRISDSFFCLRDVYQSDKSKILGLDQVVLRHLVDAHACLKFTAQSRDGSAGSAYYIRGTANLLKLLDRRQVIAFNIPRYLGMVIELMISPRDRDSLLSMFMKHFNQLTQLEQEQVIRDNKEKLICLFVFLIVFIPAGKMHKQNVSEWGLKDKVLLTSQLVEMLNIARKSAKKEKLEIVCNAVLRRFMEGSVSGKWKDTAWAAVKEKAITKLFPGLFRYFKPFQRYIGHVA